jgi:hypothetical protein
MRSRRHDPIEIIQPCIVDLINDNAADDRVELCGS